MGMEGNVYERRPSTSQQNWFEHKQQSYSNIFVTPPGTESDRVRLEKMTDAEREGSYGKIVIKDRHECEFELLLTYNRTRSGCKCEHSIAVPRIQLGANVRARTNTETNFAETEVEELIAMLRETENLEEQGDILQFLVDTQGLDFNTGMAFHNDLSMTNDNWHGFCFV